MDALNSVKCSELPNTRSKVVTITTQTPLLEGFQILLNERIQSAPVWDEKKNQWIGFLEMRDLISYCVAEEAAHATAADSELSMHMYMMQALRLSETKADIDQSEEKPMHSRVGYLAAMHPFKAIRPEDTLKDAVILLAARNTHRVAMVEPENPQVICNILSQSSVIAYISTHMSELEGLVTKTVLELGLGSRPCVAVKDTESALAALKMVDTHSFSAMAVVDSEDGKLMGNTSGSDLGYFLSSEVSLHTPVLDFLAQAKQAQPVRTKDTNTTITCHNSDPLKKVVARLAKTEVHHVFIVDDNRVPLGVISVSDICRLLASKCISA